MSKQVNWTGIIPQSWDNSATYKIVVYHHSFGAAQSGVWAAFASAWAGGEVQASNNLCNGTTTTLSQSGGAYAVVKTTMTGCTAEDINAGDKVNVRVQISTDPN